MLPHTHGPFDVPGVDLPPPFPARGTETDSYNDDGTVHLEIWSRPDGTTAETRSYTYTEDGSIASMIRVLFDIDGATVIDTLTYTYSYTADGSNTGCAVT